MKILKSSQIREVDTYTIKYEPVESIDLMERAAMAITNWISEHISNKKSIMIFAGPGNNGGDALAIARQLKHYNIEVFLLKISGKLATDCQINLDRLKKSDVKINNIASSEDFPKLNKNDVVLEGLFGSGLTRKLEELPKQLVMHLNNSGAEIISIDIPSGLYGEDNAGNDVEAIIRATHTLTFQLPKLSFLLPENEQYVGSWEILPIGLDEEFISKQESDFYFITSDWIKENLKDRSKFSHKGTYGHVLLIAGSYGKMGAAILGAKAALRTGSGLVTTHVPKIGYEIMQTALPEAMISIDWSDIIFTNIPDSENYTAIGVGPGIGTKQNTQKALTTLLQQTDKPIVIDADGLNILAMNKELLKNIPANSILTPHPKEFERLIGKATSGLKRIEEQIKFSKEHKVFVVLKGAHTSISCPDGSCYFNSTGNPGMATAGSGDVLTGMILSLVGQGYDPKMAAIIGVYLHGLSGDLASELNGEEALIASDIIENIGLAYHDIRR